MKDLTREHELKTIFLFSLPILVGNLFQQLYNLADTVIVGNFLGWLKYLDIGPSTENSIPNYGLCDFKESIGCRRSLKYTMVKELRQSDN